MFTSTRHFQLGAKTYKANTFIGGVAATLGTPTLIATKLGIASNRIKAFNIVGSDIEFCVIGGNYTTVNFNGRTDITYFIDQDGLVTSLTSNGAFQNCTSLVELTLPMCTTVTTSVVVNCTSLLVLNMPELTTCTSTANFNASFRYLYVPNVSFPKLISAGSAFSDGRFLTFSAPLMTTAGDDCFRNSINAQSIYVPNLQTIGTPSNNINALTGINANCLVTVNQSLMSNNSGQPDGDILVCPAIVEYEGYVSDNSYNLEIGGVSGTLNTRKLIGAKLSLQSGAIVNFQIVGSDIRCKIIATTYQTVSSAFSGNANITFFRDTGNKCIKFNYRSFRTASNLIEVIAPAVTEIVDECFHSVKLSSISLPSLTTVSGGNGCFNNNNLLTSIDFPSLINVTITGSVVSSTALNNINVPLLSSMLRVVTSNTQCATGVNITISSAALTSNGGSIDASLQALITNKSAVVNYV